MLCEAFIKSLPRTFQTNLDGKNKVFHKLLNTLFSPYQDLLEALNEFQNNFFDVNSGGIWLENIALKFFKIKRGSMNDEELLSEVYFAIFLKGENGSNAWILSFVKKVINPTDCFFIFNKLTMTFYFGLDENLTKQQVALLKRIKPDGITLEVFYSIKKRIIAVAKYDILPLYANGEPMDFNNKEAVVSLKAIISINAKPPLEDAYFLILEREGENPEFSTNFIKAI